VTVESRQVSRNPETFPDAQLIAKDFDGTVARTFEKSPNGIGVNESYTAAIETMFGSKALRHYLQGGGLRNRATIEVIQELAPDARGKELVQLGTTFTDLRLGVFLDEIGQRFPDGNIWPRPTPGYLELREQVDAARSQGRLIDDLILSSGHARFIEKTYRAWNVGPPTHIVAEEAIRQNAPGVPAEKLIKPSPKVMEIARSIWRSSYGIAPGALPHTDERHRIIYVGDDPVKDGELARSSGIDFILLDPANSSETWQNLTARMRLGDTALRGAHESI